MTGNVVSESGIVVSQLLPYIACSPDGLVNDDGIVEVKCPFTARNTSINPDTVPYLDEDQNGLYTLNDKHEYYYQVQGILLCTDRSWCDFTVWTHCDMKVARIARNDEFITEMVTKLTQFFNDYFKPAILKKFFYRHW
jgi:hypothetical protein